MPDGGRLVLAGGDLVLPDRVLRRGALVVDAGRIAAVHATHWTDESDDFRKSSGTTEVLDVSGHLVLPGFIDVHVHGVEGRDTLDAGDPVAEIAARLPKYGVTAFCPTSVACPPDVLSRLLRQIAGGRGVASGSARVLRAHLESNFINPAYAGAQPAACLRLPRSPTGADESAFTGGDILDVIASAGDAVGIVTLAPELPGAIDLIRTLVAAGHRVSLGHSGADFATATAAIDAGARHATHLFNRMPPLGHRDPGLAGAVLVRDDVAAEIICDGYHVHPAAARMAIAAKGASRIMAITDGTAGSGMTTDSTVRLGGQAIRVGERAAFLEDGTLAGSTATMDRVLRTIVNTFGIPLVDAARMCATTPAAELGLARTGAIAENHLADLVVLSPDLEVRWTVVNGRVVYRAAAVEGRRA
jgi:N-acetylglucosamine-6-phosphate deacetylase